MHEYVAAVRHTLPGFSPRLAFGCRSGAAGLKIIVQNFNASYFRLSLRRGRTENHCPKLQRVLLSVVAPARPDRKSLPETSTRPCFRLSLRRARTDNHYPKLQRALASVHGFVAATRHTLPSFSPRLAFGCPSGAAGQKIIARNFTAAGQNLIGRNFTASNFCLPLFSSMTYNQIIRKVH